MRRLYGFFHAAAEIFIKVSAGELIPEIIRPFKFGERDIHFIISSGIAHRAGQAPVRVVL